MNAGFFTVCERLLSATANGLYQGLIIAVIVALALRLFTRTNAATRYAIWFGTFLLVAALIPAHVLISLAPHWELHAKSVEDGATTPIVIPGPTEPVSTIAWDVPDYNVSQVQPLAVDPETISTTPHEDAADEPAVFERTVDTAETDNVATSPLPTVLKPFIAKPETFVNLPRWVCLALISAWAVLAGIRFGVLAGRLIEIRRWKKLSQAPGASLQAIFDRLCASRPERREVRLKISTAHRTALVLGFAHPAVLLPSEMDKETNDGDVEHVLRHELAHVDRWDDWGNLAQQIIEGALHFHPAIWWISRQLSLEREIACDDHVIEASGSPRAYALTLANVAIRMNQSRHSLSPGVSNNNSQLQQRITMILNARRDRSPHLARSRMGLFTATAAILAAIAINVGPRLVLAESTSPDLSGPDTAPRVKSESGDAVNVAPPAPEAAEAPEAPEAPEPPEPPEPPEAPEAPKAAWVSPMPPHAPIAVAVAPVVVARPGIVTEVSMDSDEKPEPKAAKHDRSIEERLDRLERRLDKLQERSDRAHGRAEAYAFKTDGQNQNWSPDGKPMDFNFKFDNDAKNVAEQLKREMEQAKRDAEQAKRDGQQAKRDAERDAQRAMRDMQKENGKQMAEMQEKLRGMRVQFDGSEAELEALKQARESLHHEVDKLNEQIKRLEEQRNRDPRPKRVHRDGDDGSNDSKDGQDGK
ncbi:MAG TPA: M56 family metallopeptidase [Verrucomicrobiae bacterium]|jgi:beta-lactamase regulating signal transducer with metallopeptidase domain